MVNFFLKYKLIIAYGASLGILLFLLRWLEWRFIVIEHRTELYGGIIAMVFLVVGIWLARKLAKPKTVIVEKEVYVEKESALLSNEEAVALFGLSPREIEVLRLMKDGLSNKEIADKLFVSLSTIKTHSSNVFEKLEVKRRTQAIEKAVQVGII